MTRFRQWTFAYNGLAKAVRDSGILTRSNSFKVEDEVISEFIKANKIKGDYSTKILAISARFQEFKQFVNNKAKVKP